MNVNWYQDEKTVTLSVKACSSFSKEAITTIFKEDYCAICNGADTYWECYLPHRILPKRSRFNLGKVRWELKLTKAKPGKWEEYKAEPPPKKIRASGDDPRCGSGPPNIHQEPMKIMELTMGDPQTQVMDPQIGKMDSQIDTVDPQFNTVDPPTLSIDPQINTVDPQIDTGDPQRAVPLASMPDAALPNSPVGRGPQTTVNIPSQTSTSNYILQDLMFVEHLSHDFYDMGKHVKVRVQVGGLSADSCKVIFEVRGMEVRFQTSNEKFLQMYSDHSNETCFVWKIRLYGPIDPLESRFEVHPKSLQVILQKKPSIARWKTLAAPLPRPDIHCAKVSNSAVSTTYIRTGCGVSSVGSVWSEKSTESNIDPTKTSSLVSMVTEPPSSSPSSTTADQRNVVTMVTETSNPSSPTTADPRNVSSSVSTVTEPRDSSPSSSSPSPSSISSSPSSTSPSSTSSPSPSSSSSLSQPSLTGLLNIGNSCFMSSIIQCLSNTTPLRDYFASKQYLTDINKTNPLGFHGDLARGFAEIITKLWSGSFEYTSPRTLKSVLSSRGGHFQGYQQQDSHEFMSYLLDGLHEDLNRVKDKPTTSPVECEVEGDTVAAGERAWQVHRQRNDSYLVDHFQGLFKSVLVCPTCQKVSVTFDPFMSLSVPLAGHARHLPIFFVPQDTSLSPRRYVLKLPPEAKLELLKASVARQTGIPMLQLRVFEVYNGKFQTMLSNNQQPIKSIGDDDVIIVSEVLPERTKPVEINIIQRVKVPLFPSKCHSCGRKKEALAKQLQRCSKCKAVGYCNRECQGRDWREHKMKCREGRPTPIGLPFVISCRRKDFTYSQLASIAEQLARRSVDVTVAQRTPENTTDKNTENEILQNNILCENTRLQTSIQSENTDNGTSIQSKNTKKRPMYVFVPVDRYGDNKVEKEPLVDLGDQVLPFTGQFLAMDWQNDKGEQDSVEVHPKEVLDHEADGPSSQLAPPSSSSVTLDQCIELFTQPETLTQQDAWYCPKCKEHREATKQISLWQLPHILILHLKRFSYTGHYQRDKISTNVDFPLRGLDMRPFMLGEATSLLLPEAPPIYDLYATVNHYGAAYRGHYIAQVNPPHSWKTAEGKEWLLYDDESVKRIHENQVVDRTAYILFYRLRHSNSSKL